MEGNWRGGLFAKAAKVFLGGEREPLLAQKASRYVLRKERPRLRRTYAEKSSKKTASVCVWVVCVCVKGAFLTEKGYIRHTMAEIYYTWSTLWTVDRHTVAKVSPYHLWWIWPAIAYKINHFDIQSCGKWEAGARPHTHPLWPRPFEKI